MKWDYERLKLRRDIFKTHRIYFSPRPCFAFIEAPATAPTTLALHRAV